MSNRLNAPLKVLAVAVAVALAAGCANITGGPGVPAAGTAPVDDGMRATTNARVRDFDDGSKQKAEAQPAPAPAAPPVEQAAAPAEPPPPQTKTVKVADTPPPSAKPGECYTKLLIPAEYKTEAVQTVVKPASERLEYSDPVYEEVEEQVVVKPASKRMEVVPAEYATVEEKVVVREAYRREIEIPALYNTYFEQVVERPARQVWKPGRGAVERVDEVTGEILCLVDEPPVYKTVERKELARPASKRYEDVPAEYAAVTKTIVKTPETVREVEVPAEYQTITVRKLTKPAQKLAVPVEAEYGTVEKKVMVQGERAEWVQVLCDQNTTSGKVEEIKRALQAKGYDVQPDGNIDKSLTDALRSFQEQEGLRRTGLMTADTLSALGVALQ
ncbi:MAG TPA: peptidoglycan-binding domain-containing protein [Burkholderiales bacterium]|nr:peptidoglycan-binding domain-containing protein [Burkholderiales bacterium]